jgi:lipooligosaccharide transport system ATP-binding protein
MDEAQRLCDRVAIVATGKVIAHGAPTALIRSHLAREAVEFDCAPDEEAALIDGTAPPHRLRSGRRLICYLDDASALVERLKADDPEDRRALIVRPANLEDVFLRIAGSTLEGGA